MNKTAEEKILKLVTRINRRAHKKGATEKLEPYQVLQRWENTIFCAICGRYIKLQNASLDHVVPLTNGGSNAIWNILIVQTQVAASNLSITPHPLLQLMYSDVYPSSLSKST